MFTNFGWGEILVVFIVGLIVVGPERLPRVIEDIRAGIYAARNAIDNAKKELAGELGPEFEQIAEPLNDLKKLRGMTPRAALTRTLLDGDDSFLDAFDPRTIMAEDTAGQAQRKRSIPPGQDTPETTRVQRPEQAQAQPQPQVPAQPQSQPPAQPPTGNANSFDDVI